MATLSVRCPLKTPMLQLAALHDRKESGRTFVILLQDDAIPVSFNSSLCVNSRVRPVPFLPIPAFPLPIYLQDMLSEGRSVYVHTSCCIREALMVPPLHCTTPLGPL